MASQYNLITLAVVAVTMMAFEAIPAESNTGGRKLVQTIPPKKIQVVMNNILEGRENMEVHCQGDNEDFGVQQVPSGEHYTIDIWPSGSADYYCTFLFNEIRHRFDVYLNGREAGCGVNRVCTWNIKESGPCFQDANLPKPQCYTWDQN